MEVRRPQPLPISRLGTVAETPKGFRILRLGRNLPQKQLYLRGKTKKIKRPWWPHDMKKHHRAIGKSPCLLVEWNTTDDQCHVTLSFDKLLGCPTRRRESLVYIHSFASTRMKHPVKTCMWVNRPPHLSSGKAPPKSQTSVEQSKLGKWTSTKIVSWQYILIGTLYKMYMYIYI